MKPLFQPDATLPKEQRIVFLGDSLTDNGTYIAYLDAYFRLHAPDSNITLINLGVSSETTSGLSEPSHPFPRPVVFDRLGRALEKSRPDWVLVCYGLNDGIYYPFSEKRFAAYRDGMLRLLRTIRAYGAKAIALTPPPFDALSVQEPERLQPEGESEYSYDRAYAQYETVMQRYADWILSLDDSEADGVVNIHGPMLAQVAAARRVDPGYRSGDGVHPNARGHWEMAKEILRALFNVTLERTPDDVTDDEPQSKVYALVQQRHQLMSAAWKEHVGHTNPSKAEHAKPLPEALAASEELEDRIRQAVSEHPEERRRLRESEWRGCKRLDFMLGGREGLLVLPKTPAAGNPWIWRAEFFDAFASADEALLRQGWSIAYYRLSDMYGSPGAVERMRDFQRDMTETCGLADKTVLFGFSRGGLYSFNYAATYPEQVALLYLDAPAVDLRRWPGDKSRDSFSAQAWLECLTQYGLTEDTFADARVSPIDRVEPVAAAKIPILIVTGDQDEAVPMEQNALVLAERYRQLGGEVELIIKPGGKHHPHSLSDPEPIVKFIVDRVRFV
ncbi:GDSL-type esterase/lipase family protein [Cohnella yongneupensis]|uniref:GDSL-type esterase/lipase family protein n=1 Tax=Cohnella yongneupensis TaxID=425006 RepID=A0ABW0QUW4_9BACL